VRLAALNSISLWRDRDALPELRRLVLTESPEARLAAEALGRIGGPVALSDLLTSANGATTREMQHAVTYALWEIGDAAGLEEALQSPSLKSQAAAAMALDQLDSSAVHSDQAIAWLKSDSLEARETARWLMARHSEWGAALADDFRQRLKQKRSEAEASALLGDLLLFTQSPEIQQLVGSTLADASQPRASRLLAAEAMRLSNVRQLPDSWKEGLTTAIAGDDHELTARAIAAARSLAPPETDAEEFNSALRKAAGNTELTVDQRLDALAALAGGAGALDDETFQFLTSHLTPEDAVHDRAAAIRVLHDAALSTRQLITLAAAFNAIGPLEAPRLLEVFSQSSTDDVGHALVSALETSPALMSLRVDALTQTLSKYGPDVQSHIEPLASRINVNLAQQRQQLEAMLTRVSEGDVRRGLAVFHSAKAGCASCHQMGYVGGNIGPDLSKIGQVRAERDLLEAIMFPSASFVRSYEPVMLQLTDGRVESGLLKEETGGELVLIKSATETLRIPQQEIEVLRPGTTSVMPAGFGQQLSSQDLADLTVFLKSLQ
jgi:putative heme-binding domain-containing protein